MISWPSIKGWPIYWYVYTWMSTWCNCYHHQKMDSLSAFILEVGGTVIHFERVHWDYCLPRKINFTFFFYFYSVGRRNNKTYKMASFFFFFFFFFSINPLFSFLVGIWWSISISKSMRILCVSFSRTCCKC